MDGRRVQRFALAAVAALVVAATGVLVASAAPSPRVMKVGCASDLYGMKQVLRYVARAAECKGRGNRLVRFEAGAPVIVCLEERAVSVGLGKLVRGVRSKAPAGLMRLVDSPRSCKPGSRLYETARTLPASTALWFCAAKKSGELRKVGKGASCGSREFRVTLPKRKKSSSGPPVGGETPGDTPADTPGGPPDETPGEGPAEAPGDNSAPVAGDDIATTAKNSSVQISVLTNDADPDGDTLHVASIDTTGTHGSVTQGESGTLTYDPNHQFDSLGAGQSAHDTFKYEANDGHQDSSAATVDVTVTGSNTSPVVTTSSGSTAYTEGATAAVVDSGVTVTDPDSANLASAQVRLSSGFQAGDELLFSGQNGITGSYATGTGVLTLSGSASKASYQTALRSVRYRTGTNSDPSTSKTAEFKASDGTTTSTAATKHLAITPVSPTDPLDAMVAHDLSFARTQLQRTLTETATDEYPLETGTAGRWETSEANEWTSGFFPGSLWLMYQATGDSAWRTAAQARQAGIESQKTNTGTDDLGFMLFNSFGNGYRLTGTDSYRQVAVTAAQSLATRYNPAVGAIRGFSNAAGQSATDFQTIIDDLLNLELLFWASKHGGPSSLADKALQNALTVIGSHIRTDGSSWHLVVFNSDNGSVKRKGTVQGYSDNSTWARGQAWGVYGFTMAYRESNDARMLTAARRMADWYIAHLPSDSIPYWDFNAPGIPNEPRDTSAAAVAASGLIELSRLETDATRKQRYLDAAKATLTSLSSSAYLAEGTSARSILLHGTYNKPAGNYDSGLIWGDYYFLEALLRYQALS